MGLFGSKTKTTVGTSIVRVIKDNMLPNSLLSGVMKSTLGNGNLTTNLLRDTVNGLAITADQYMDKGRSPRNPWGAPTGSMRAWTQGAAAAKARIEQLEGGPVSLVYSRVGKPNYIHMGWMHLVSAYEYNFATNELRFLSRQFGYPVYLKDMQLHIPRGMATTLAEGTAEVWGDPPNSGKIPTAIDSKFTNTDTTFSSVFGSTSSLRKLSPMGIKSDITEPYLQVVYVIDKNTKYSLLHSARTPITKEFTLSLDELTVHQDLSTDNTYFSVSYEVNGVRKWWMYEVGSGVYPELDNVNTTTPNVYGDFFPFGYFRYNYKNELDTQSTDTLKYYRELFNTLGIHYDTVADAINDNPNIKDVIQAIFMMGVDVKSTDSVDREYLFKYFDMLANTHDPEYKGYRYDWIKRGDGYSDLKRTQTDLHVTIKDKRFEMTLQADSIKKVRKVGTPNKKGTYLSGYGYQTRDIDTVDVDNSTIFRMLLTGSYYWFRYYITDTLYEEIQVTNLRSRYRVSGGHWTTMDGNNDVLIIPVDRAITKDMELLKRERIYARSLHVVFNSMVVTKLKWYQTGIFQVIMIIVSVVIAFWDGGYTLTNVLAMSATAFITLLIQQILITVVVGQFVQLALEALAKVLGAEFALILAIIAAVIAFDPQTLINNFLSSQQLLQLSNGLINAGMKEKMGDLLGEFKELDAWKKQMQEEIDTAKSLLDESPILAPIILWGESPDQFYSRTVHSGNIGAVGIRALYATTDISLLLPTVNTSLGGPQYAY